MSQNGESKKHILIASPSVTMGAMISSLCSDIGFDCEIVRDGENALKSVLEKGFDCVVICSTLPVLDAYQFSRVIRKSGQFGNIPIILCVSELTKEVQFSATSAGITNIYEFDSNNPEKICDCIQETLQSLSTPSNLVDEASLSNINKVNVAKTAKTNITSADLLALTVTAFDKDRFESEVLKTLFILGTEKYNLDNLIKAYLHLLAGICTYDVSSIIIDGTVLREYTTHVEGLSQSELSDFQAVCHHDFEVLFDGRKAYEYKSAFVVFNNEHQVSPGTIRRIQSYECIPLTVKGHNLGTLHIGHIAADKFTDNVKARINLFAAKASIMLEIVIYYHKMTDESQKIRTLFSRFVPVEIIDDMINQKIGQDSLFSEKRKVSILISDIREFTAISELNEPEEVVTFLNSYFALMVDIIRKYGGCIDKFMGDAVMALFGAPVSYEDNERRAVMAAREMSEAVNSINLGHLRLPPELSFNIGIGIHSGDVIVGSIGCADKSDYTVIGDTVNLASRVEGLTKQYGVRIVITEPVKNKLDKETNIRLLDIVKVKGKSVPVAIYSVEDENFRSEAFCSAYSKAMKSYKNGVWSLAADYFHKAIDVYPDDKAALLMYERCINFKNSPPVNWDGAVSLTSK